MHLYKQGGELIDVLDLSVEEHTNSEDNKVLYIPESKVMEWLNSYPDTFITGDLWVNTKQPALLKKKLDHIQLSRRDDFYVVDNKNGRKESCRNHEYVSKNSSVLSICIDDHFDCDRIYAVVSTFLLT